jgi:hypothetical protein
VDEYFIPFARKIAGSPAERFLTTDADGDNEFGPIMPWFYTIPPNPDLPCNDLTNDCRGEIVKAIDELRDIIKNFSVEMDGISSITPNGAGTLSYEWDDSAGKHKVTVETGPFILPELTDPEKTGNWLKNKTCQEVKYYCENSPGCPSQYNLPFDRTWVKVSREDPANTPINKNKNVIGIWNPLDNSGGKISISRESVAKFSYDQVGLYKTKAKRR